MDDMDRSDTLDWAQSEIRAMAYAGEREGLALSANSCREIASWLQKLLDVSEHSARLEAIVRDLAAANGTTRDLIELRQRAREWVDQQEARG